MSGEGYIPASLMYVLHESLRFTRKVIGDPCPTCTRVRVNCECGTPRRYTTPRPALIITRLTTLDVPVGYDRILYP